MLGWINDCVEKLVLDKFGVDAWHIIKQKAGCDVPDGGFLKLEHYTDKSTMDLVVASSEVSGLTVPQVLEAFGAFFVYYIRGEGYGSLLCCQGSTLRDWCCNINAIHQHLQTTFPKKMIMPNFWCTDGENGSLILHYFSKRGNILAPLAKGLVAEIAKFQFDVDIEMTQTHLQDENGSKFTSWSVNAVDPSQQWKLTKNEGMRDGVKNSPTNLKCPFTGMTVLTKPHDSVDRPKFLHTASRRFSASTIGTSTSTHTSSTEDKDDEMSEHSVEKIVVTSNINNVGMSATVTKALFPYSIVINEDFDILQIGQNMAKVLRKAEDEILGSRVMDVLEITQPLHAEWNWDWLRKLEDQTFQVDPVIAESDCNVLFKASIILVADNPVKAMLIMAPDASNLNDLMKMGLTLSDLPVHGDYRDAVFLREHLSSQMNNALKMEKLSKNLAREKQLLESLLPQHAADGLRAGKQVEPRLHQNVTVFFSDIVGFTNICKQIYPWDVITMLNRLYCVMDFLASKFKLFKIETIGDAYVCCSGLPLSEEEHAEKVANFAIAVTHCCRQVISPVSSEPILLRIGIHTGPAASGVVGTTNPRYCVFGDTMNTCARHESTGAAGKIHCSKTTAEHLMNRNASSMYTMTERGTVEMKGKGKQRTYWLSGSDENGLVNKAALQQLDVEVADLLSKTNFSDKCDSQSPNFQETTSMRTLDLEAYIEDEVERRVKEASETIRLNLDDAEETGTIREVNVETQEQEDNNHSKYKKRSRLRKMFWFV